MRDYICPSRHGEHRCWVRANHDGHHFAVEKNVDPDTRTRPVVITWAAHD